MTLSPADLDAIRAIVRDELRRAHGGTLPAPEVPERDDVDPYGCIAELARAHAAQMRDRPGAEEMCIRAEARYRLYHFDDWVDRARRWLRKERDAAVSEAEMERYVRAWNVTKKRAQEKARSTRAAKRGSATRTRK